MVLRRLLVAAWRGAPEASRPDAYHVRDMPARSTERVARIERLLAGSCRPTGFRDVLHVDCG